MPIQLNDVIPWGRSFDEYVAMFALTASDLEKKIVSIADGPASFNVELTERGGRVVSLDPIYQFAEAEIRRRIAETSADIIEQSRRNADGFVWTDEIPDPDALGKRRMEAMERFLQDFGSGARAGRYLVGELPAVPFADKEFELAVCSHFLFLYSNLFSAPFHLESLLGLARVAAEVRVFPLLDLNGQPSPHLPSVTESLRQRGHTVTIETVPYEFQRGGNQMMRIRTVAGVERRA